MNVISLSPFVLICLVESIVFLFFYFFFMPNLFIAVSLSKIVHAVHPGTVILDEKFRWISGRNLTERQTENCKKPSGRKPFRSKIPEVPAENGFRPESDRKVQLRNVQHSTIPFQHKNLNDLP